MACFRWRRIVKKIASGGGVSVTLNALSVPSSGAISGVLSISGATAGSTISSSNLPTGVTLNSAARTITLPGTEQTLAAFTLVETLAGATNTPRSTSIGAITVTASDIFTGGEPSSTTTVYDGTGIANGTAITTAYSDLTGDITGSASGAYITGNQLGWQSPSTGDDTLTKTLPTANFKVSLKVGAGFGSNIIWDYVSRTNYCTFSPIAGDGAHFILAGPGGFFNYVDWGRPIVTGTDVVELERAGNSLIVKLNGTPVGSPITQPSITHTNVVGIQKNGGGFWDDWSITSTATAPLALGGVSYDLEGIPTLTGTYSGSAPTALQYRFQMLDGSASTGWNNATGTISGGEFSVVGAASLRALTIQTARIQVRALDSGTPRADMAIKTSLVPAIQGIPAMIKGLNSSAAYGYVYYSGLIGPRDRFKQASIRTSAPDLDGDIDNSATILQPLQTAYSTYSTAQVAASEVGMGFDGVVHNYRSGSTFFKYIMPYWWEPGEYQVGNLPSGMSVTFDANGSDATYNSTTKVLTTGGGLYLNLGFTFTGTIPAGGINPTMYKVGDTNTSRAYAETRATAIAALMPGSGVLRGMDEKGTNGLQVGRSGASQIWTGSTSLGPSSPALDIGLANAAGKDWWENINLLASDAEVTYLATQYATGISGTTYVEVSNEVWNTAFPQWFRSVLNGMAAGFYNVNGDAGAQTILDGSDKFSFEGGGGARKRIPLQNYNSGDKVALNDGGFFLRQANRAITANNNADAMENETNAAWTVLADPGASARAGLRYYSKRCKDIFALWDAAYVAAGVSLSKRVRVVAWQNAVLTDAKEILAWNNLWQNYDAFANAAYWGGGQANYDIGNWDQNNPGWTATERNLILTDVPAFKTAMFAYFSNSVIPATIQEAVIFKQALAKWLYDTYGVLPNARRYVNYEGGNWHWITQNWPGQQSPFQNSTGAAGALSANWVSILRDARMGDMMTQYMAAWKARIGDTLATYQMGGYTPNSGQIQTWDLQENESDLTTARIAAFKNFVP